MGCGMWCLNGSHFDASAHGYSAPKPCNIVCMIAKFFNTSGPTIPADHYHTDYRQSHGLAIRAGYAQRPEAFPQSIILCGVRDVRVGADEAHLIIFDRNPNKTWSKKIWRKVVDGLPVWGC